MQPAIEELTKTGGPDQAPVYTRSFYDPEDDRIIHFGGWGPVGSGDDMETRNEVWSYDYNSNTWEQKADNELSDRMAWHTPTYIDSIDRSLVFGEGDSWDDFTGNRLFSYDPTLDTWTEIVPS